MKNQNYRLKEECTCHKENVGAVVNKALEKERMITNKKISLITTVANKMSSRLSDIRNKNLVICDTNKTKLVNQKEKYVIELDRVRNKLEKAHSVAMDKVNSNHRKILAENKNEHRRELAAVHKQNRENRKQTLVAEENLNSIIETMKQKLKTLLSVVK